MARGQAKQPNNKLIAEFTAFMANGQGRNAQRFKHQAIKGTNTYHRYTNPRQNQRSDKPQNKFKGKKKYDPNLSCTYCGKTGHIKANASLTQQADEDIGKTDFEINDGNFEEQFSKQQIVEMMQIYKQSKLTQIGKTKINANVMNGTILKYSNSVPTNLEQNTWIINSGALEHMCFDPNSFLFLNPLPVPLNINLPNSFKDLSMKSPQVFGEVREGLYLLDSNSDKPRIVFNSNDVSSIPKERNPISQSISVFNSVHVNAAPHVKLWHVRFFLTIVDDYSKGTWTFLLSTKSNAFPILKSFLSMVERQFNVRVKMIRSDNALELGKGTQKSAFLASQGILHQFSCVATPQQNGTVERKHRHLLEIARGLMFQSKLPMCYWGESVLTATHIINRLSSSVLKGQTPYEVLFRQKPTYDHLRNFGCLCYTSTLAQERNKFDEKAIACVLLGYPLQQKEYKLLSLDTKKVFISRDVSSQSESTLSQQTTPTAQPPHLDHAYPSSTALDTSTPDPITDKPRRSSRISHEPRYLRDYICNSVMFTDLWKACFDHSHKAKRYVFSFLSLNNQQLLHSLSNITEPSCYSQASHHPAWIETMSSEIQALETNRT
ncbi:uncharacterized protein LOC129899873 [Solanum dulcamara]|uniref:uncharacterized protein LOC129899873 n=1 Tax=Solanum dulcamara TaxID=45834 RepID=UPI00248633ED|nr:uncharacterized protein LOC129899873 [Solanum dulcamara]